MLIAVRLVHAPGLGFGNAVTLLVLTLSAWVGISGAIADLSTLDFCIQDDAALEALCWYTPEFSPLWQPVVDFPSLELAHCDGGGYGLLVFVYLAMSPTTALLRAIRELPWHSWASGWRV